MAGKGRLDTIEARVARLEDARDDASIAAFLRTLPFEVLGEMEAAIVNGADPVAVLKEYSRHDRTDD